MHVQVASSFEWILAKISKARGVGGTHLWRGDLDVDDNGGEGGLAQLRRMVDGVGIQNHQLQRSGQLKNPLNLALDLSCRKISTRFFFLLFHIVMSLNQTEISIFLFFCFLE